MTASILDTAQEFPAIIGAFVFCVGACMGSFLNVCVYRIQRGMSIVRPASRCECGKPVAWYDNIPILSWFMLRGRARCCGAKLSLRHPIVETLTGAIFLAVWIQLPFPNCAIGMLFASLMVFCAFYDIDTMTLPDFATIGGTLLGACAAAAFPSIFSPELDGAPFAVRSAVSLMRSAIGAVAAAGTLYWIRLLSGCIFRKEAMGEGDVILAGCIGAFCGWQGGLIAIFIGSLIGSLVMLPVMAISSLIESMKAPNTESKPTEQKTEGDDEQSQSGSFAIPFGPWLAFGALLYMIFFKGICDAYLAGISSALFGV